MRMSILPKLRLRGLMFLVLGSIPLVSVVAMMAAEVSSVRVDGLRQRLRQLVSSPLISDTRKSNGVILIDGDNVRGKTKFQLSKEELCDRVREWMTISSLSGLVVLMFDHGSKHSGTYIPDSKLAVVFSGPGRSADDVITRDVGWFQNIQQRDVVIITEDNGLKRRCRTSLKGRASARGKQKKKGTSTAVATDVPLTKDTFVPKELTFVGSPLFAEMLMAMRPLSSSSASGSTHGQSHGQSSTTATTTALRDNNEEQHRQAAGREATGGIGIHPMLIGTSPSGTLETVGGIYNPQIALIRKEVDLRRQLNGLKVALSNRKCTRKTALKLRAKEVELKRRLGLVVAATSELTGSGSAGVSEVELGSETALDLELEPALESGVPELGLESELDSETELGAGITSESLSEPDSSSSSSSSSSSGLSGGMTLDTETSNVVDRGAELLAKLLAQGRPAGTVEETWERIILAEQLRFQLEQQYGSLGVVTQEAAVQEEEKTSMVHVHGSVDMVSTNTGDEEMDVGALYVIYINRNFAVPSYSSDSLSKKKTMT